MSNTGSCVECGFEGNLEELHAHTCETQNVSEPSDTMDLSDHMIEAASLPDLASLFKNAQDQGLITPQVVGSGQPT